LQTIMHRICLKPPVAAALFLAVLAGCGQAQPPEPVTFRGSVEVSAKPKTGSDWPCFLGPTHDGKSTETGILTNWPETGPPIVWHRPLGTSYGIGSVADGRYYQFDRHGDEARLTCLDAASGEFLWKFGYPTDYEDYLGYNNGPRCSPVVDDDRVYVFGAGGMLHCVNGSDGSLVWKVDTARRFGVVQNFFGVGSTPVVEGDLLIVMVGGSPPESQEAGRYDMGRVQPNGTAIVAFDKRTGEVRYTAGDELASYAVPQMATIGGRRWGFLFARGGLIGFEPSTGAIDFHFPWRAQIHDSVNAATPVVVGDEVLITETYGPGAALLRVKPGGYDVVWQDRPSRNMTMQAHWNTPIYHEGYLYGSSGRHKSNAELRCVEWETGRVMWSERRLTRASLLYVDGHFVCLSEDGMLRLIEATPEAYRVKAEVQLRDAETGEPLLQEPAWAAPILAHGLLYVRGRDRVVCLQLIAADSTQD
jgi:outer membrane protein assembly factor BamB